MPAYVVTARRGRAVNIEEFARMAEAEVRYSRVRELVAYDREMTVDLFAAPNRKALAAASPAVAGFVRLAG